MDMFKKINVSHVIWYLLPGLGLILFILFPLMVFNPHVAASFLKVVGVFGIIVLGIILGFFLDGLRLYRLLRLHHSKFRNAFFEQLQETISDNLDPYFILSCINDIANNKKFNGISLHHAILIMLGHFTVLAFIEAIFWALACFYLYYSSNSVYPLFDINICVYNAINICFMFSVLFFIIGWRFFIIYKEDQNNTNCMYLNFAKQHREEIRQLLNITPSE